MVGDPLHLQSPLPKRLTESLPWKRLACLSCTSTVLHTLAFLKVVKRETGKRPSQSSTTVNRARGDHPPNTDMCPAPSRGPRGELQDDAHGRTAHMSYSCLGRQVTKMLSLRKLSTFRGELPVEEAG